MRFPSLCQVNRQQIWTLFSLFLQLCKWDLWQMTHSYLDIYFPHRAIAVAKLGLLPFRLPTGTSHHMDHVKRTPLCSCMHDLCTKYMNSCSHITASEARACWDVILPSNPTFHVRYHPLDKIQSFMCDLATVYLNQVAIIPLGHSGEGRKMFALEISALPTDSPHPWVLCLTSTICHHTCVLSLSREQL